MSCEDIRLYSILFGGVGVGLVLAAGLVGFVVAGFFLGGFVIGYPAGRDAANTHNDGR